MKTRILSIFCAAIAVTACNTDDSASSSLSTSKVEISPIITRATELNFEDGDKLGVTVIQSDGTSYADNVEMTYVDGVFSGDLQWYPEATTTSTVMAYYPYATTVPTSFTVATDQSGDGYTASDLIAGVKADVTPSTSAVIMTFKHLLTRIVIDMDNQSGSAINTVKIAGAYTSADFDLETATVVVDETSSKSDITAGLISVAKSSESSQYQLILIPQTVALELIVETELETLSQKFTLAELSQSGQYTADITVLPGEIVASFTGDIEGWEDAGSLTPDSGSGDEAVSFEEFDGYFIYDGVTYNTITLSNGSTWMTENLCYVPNGYTPSSDPEEWSGMWYPYKMDYDQMVIDGTVGISPDAKYVVNVTDEAGIKSLGYLYDIEVALTGGVKITEENCYDFEGAQGICPPGWHVPTRAEYFDLVGLSNKNALGESGNQVNENALFYDEAYGSAPIPKVNEGGFNYIFTGYRFVSGFEDNVVSTTARYQTTMLQSSNTSVTEWYGELALSYYMTSTCYQPNYSTTVAGNPWYNTQFFAVMSTFTSSLYPTGRLSLAYISAHAGQALRCVKDSE